MWVRQFLCASDWFVGYWRQFCEFAAQFVILIMVSLCPCPQRVIGGARPQGQWSQTLQCSMPLKNGVPNRTTVRFFKLLCQIVILPCIACNACKSVAWLEILVHSKTGPILGNGIALWGQKVICNPGPIWRSLCMHSTPLHHSVLHQTKCTSIHTVYHTVFQRCLPQCTNALYNVQCTSLSQRNVTPGTMTMAECLCRAWQCSVPHTKVWDGWRAAICYVRPV